MPDVVTNAGLAYHIQQDGEWGTLPPHPSLQTSPQSVQHYESDLHGCSYRKDLSRKRPAVPCQPPAAPGQHFITRVPVAVSIRLGSVLPAKKTGLIYLAFQQIREKKII